LDSRSYKFLKTPNPTVTAASAYATPGRIVKSGRFPVRQYRASAKAAQAIAPIARAATKALL
jgi:hypothetical protein